jgi:competence protein ComGC
MKSKALLFLGICLVAQFVYGQTPATTATPAAATDTATQKQLTEIKDQLADIKKIIKDNGKDQKTIVGTIILKKKEDVTQYGYNVTIKNNDSIDNHYYDLKKNIKIDSITILTKDGYMVDIQIFANNDIFTNKRAPIEVSQSRISKSDMLGNGQGNYIDIGEIIKYKSIKPYIPDNDYFTLSSKDSTHDFSKGVGLNTIFDLRLYSDALGVLGGNANGLVQTDAYFKQVFHRSNIFNRGIFLFNYLKFNFNASKFDSKVAYTDSSKFTRTSLFQKNWLSTDLAVNIINGWLGKKTLSSYYLDFGGGVSLSNLATPKDTTTITSTYLFLQPGIDLKIADNIGFDFVTRFIWTYSPQTDFNNQAGKRLFIKPTVGIFWNPVGNEASRIFGRVSYNVDTKDKKENFLQLQFGYSLQLTSLVK